MPNEVMSAVARSLGKPPIPRSAATADFTTIIQPIEQRAGVTVGKAGEIMSDDIHEVYAVSLCRTCAQALGELHLRRPARRDDVDRLLRLGDQGAARHLRLRHRLRRGRRKGAQAQDHPSGWRRAQARSALRPTRSITSSPPICIGTTPATTICSRTRAITSRIPRWPTPPAAACATGCCASRSAKATCMRW